MKKCERWLRSWCGIHDIEQILNLLKVLSIKYFNTESDLEDKTKSTLKNVFKTLSIDEVHTKIISYISKNSTFTGAIRPRHLLFILKDHLLPEVNRWTQFQTGGSNWNISGIHDLEHNTEIERPAFIVPALWSTDNTNARSLKIDGTCVENCLVSESLMRLSLHSQGSSFIPCSDKSSWVYSIRTKTGGTLGVAANDLNDSRILDRSEPSSSSELRELTTIDEQNAEAKKLHDEMYKVTFKLVNTELTAAIRGMNNGDLRTEVESRWSLWKETLESDVEEQRKLFSKMLRPKAEGESISGELRVGPKTVALLKDALFLLLVVSVCLSDNDNENRWESATDKLKITSVGLAYWSGPANGSKKVVEIDDDYGIDQLIGKESAKILILGKSQSTVSEIFNDDLTGGVLDKIGSMSHGNTPKLLITKDMKLRRLVDKGEINALKKHFKEQLKKYDDVINSSKQKVAS